MKPMHSGKLFSFDSLLFDLGLADGLLENSLLGNLLVLLVGFRPEFFQF